MFFFWSIAQLTYCFCSRIYGMELIGCQEHKCFAEGSKMISKPRWLYKWHREAQQSPLHTVVFKLLPFLHIFNQPLHSSCCVDTHVWFHPADSCFAVKSFIFLLKFQNWVRKVQQHGLFTGCKLNTNLLLEFSPSGTCCASKNQRNALTSDVVSRRRRSKLT